jgi:hypothetical protein
MNTIAGIYSNSLTNLTLNSEAQVRINQARALFVRMTDDTGAYVAPGGGTTDGTTFTAGASSLSPVGGVYDDSVAAVSSGKVGEVRLTNNRAMHVNLRDHLGNEATLTGNSLNVNVTNGAAGGTSQADKSAFTVGTTNGTPDMGVARTDVPDLVADATAVVYAATLRRGLHVNLRSQVGAELLGQKTMAGSIPVVIGSDQSTVNVALAANQSVNVAQINGVTPLMGTGVMGTGSQRVTIASDNDPLTVKQATAANLKCLIDINAAQTLATVTTVSTVTNLSQLGGTAIAMNTGVRAAGVQRVTICTDDIVPASQSGTWNIGTVTSLTQFNGQAIALNTGTRSAGTLRVTIATDDVVPASQSGTWTVQPGNTANTTPWLMDCRGNVADAAADSGNPVKIGGRYLSAPGTALSTGNRGDLFIDDQHSLVVTGAMRAWVVTQTTTITASTSETTIVTAGAAGVFNDLQTLILTNSSATATSVTIKDATAGTTRMIIDLAANGGAVINLPVRHPQAVAANNWTATSSASITSLHVYALCVTRK